MKDPWLATVWLIIALTVVTCTGIVCYTINNVEHTRADRDVKLGEGPL